MGNDGGAVADAPPADGTINEKGGVVVSADGNARLEIPAGAVDGVVSISLTPTSDFPADPLLVPGTTYKLTPEGLTFEKPVTLTISYAASAVPGSIDETALRIHKVVANAWTLVAGGTVSPATSSASAQLTGFSVYGVRARDQGSDAGGEADAALDGPQSDGPLADAAAPDAAPPLSWTCLGNTGPWPGVSSSPLTFSFRVKDLQSQATFGGATVKACNAADTACASPVATTTVPTPPTYASMSIPIGANGFDGYLEATAPGYHPSLWFPRCPVVQNQSPPNNLIYPAVSQLTALAASVLLGVTMDPSRGHVILSAYDCTLFAAHGVTFTVSSADSASVLAYLDNSMLPNKTLTATGKYGSALVGNVPVGPATVSAKIVSTGQVIASKSIFVRAGSFSFMGLYHSDWCP